MSEEEHTVGEVWTAHGKNVFRGKDCIGIFDTDTGTDAFMAERARLAAAAPDLLAFIGMIANFSRPNGDAEDDANVIRALIDTATSLCAQATGAPTPPAPEEIPETQVW